MQKLKDAEEKKKTNGFQYPFIEFVKRKKKKTGEKPYYIFPHSPHIISPILKIQ